MDAFEKRYDGLNDRQKAAVDRIEGPLLVIAGPGTGKTELLSARVANIIRQTGTPANNILCLTFTNSGQTAMTKRLTQYLGTDGHRVHVHTYHSFGSTIIRENPGYFVNRDFETAIDNVTNHKLITEIQSRLPYGQPLKRKRDTNNIIAAIKEVKENLLSATDIALIAKTNTSNAKQINRILSKLPLKSPHWTHYDEINQLFSTYLDTLNELKTLAETIIIDRPDIQIYSEAHALASSLSTAVQQYDELAKPSTKPLTTWRNQFLVKDAKDKFILDSAYANRVLLSLSIILAEYEKSLEAESLYDYTDMILEAIRAIEANPDLKFTLQERYQYILLDEYQDTNPAQQRIVSLLTDNPIHEGRPNIMAVGDDDQAIYSFQGADARIFQNYYERNHLASDDVICLTDNYRSSDQVIKLANQMRNQLDYKFADKTNLDISKQLTTHHDRDTKLEFLQFDTYLQENEYIAQQIANSLHQDPNQSIAIIAPRHKYLESIVPALKKHNIPVIYDKRENILEAPLIKQVINIARLAIAIHNGTPADHLWPEVLSYPYWHINLSDIWQLSREARAEGSTWFDHALANPDIYPDIAKVARLISAISLSSAIAPLELSIDYIIGSQPAHDNSEPPTESEDLTSPIKEYYMAMDDATIYETLSLLHTLRETIRSYAGKSDSRLYLADLIQLYDDYAAADQKIISTINFRESGNGVTLLSAHQSKGLEFEHAYLISSNDHTWSNAKGNNNQLSLPHNMLKIRHTGATDDEKLRLLFVAITRAKSYLTITYASHDLDDTTRTPLHYYANSIEAVTPTTAIANPTLEDLETSWYSGHIQAAGTMRDFFAAQLEKYTMPATHLNNFTDLSYMGPHKFFVNNFLRFPEAPSAHTNFGTAIHAALEYAQSHPDNLDDIVAEFVKAIDRRQITDREYDDLVARGTGALAEFMKQRGTIFQLADVETELSLATEKITIGPARITGKIDRIEIDKTAKTITVVDYKTGLADDNLKDTSQKKHNAITQLYFYKLLIENTARFRGYRVTTGRIEYVEPDEKTGKIHSPEIQFADPMLNRTRQLLCAVWDKIMNFDFPDTTNFYRDKDALKNSKQFEQDLIDGK
jgi:DNA helicase-2/ATP-dependent DNA helicase PcrA